MNTVLEQMLAKYELNSDYDRVNALKEILQEITLCGLSRAGFLERPFSMVEQPCECFMDWIDFQRSWIFLLRKKMRRLICPGGLLLLRMRQQPTG